MKKTLMLLAALTASLLALTSCAMTEKSTQLQDTGAIVLLGDTSGVALQLEL